MVAARLIAFNGLLAESAAARGDLAEAFAKLRLVAHALDEARDIVAIAGKDRQMTDLSDYSNWPPEKRDAYFAKANREYRRGDDQGTAEGARAPLPLVPPSPAAQPYPVEALGPILSGAANSIAAKCQCAPALAAQSVLAVAALAAQKLADVRLPYGQTRPLTCFYRDGRRVGRPEIHDTTMRRWRLSPGL